MRAHHGPQRTRCSCLIFVCLESGMEGEESRGEQRRGTKAALTCSHDSVVNQEKMPKHRGASPWWSRVGAIESCLSKYRCSPCSVLPDSYACLRGYVTSKHGVRQWPQSDDSSMRRKRLQRFWHSLWSQRSVASVRGLFF